MKFSLDEVLDQRGMEVISRTPLIKISDITSVRV